MWPFSLSNHRGSHIPSSWMRQILREALFAVVCVNWTAHRNWQTKLRDTRKATTQKLFRQDSVNELK